MADADELLLGRKTYEGFAEAWPQRSGDPFTEKINAMPKHVATRTLTDLSWNARPLEGDAIEAVGELKQRDGQNLLKYGTGQFSRALTALFFSESAASRAFSARFARSASCGPYSA